MNTRAFENDDAYQVGYDDACTVTNELMETLMEDVEQYHRRYVHLLKQYEAHMRACSRRSEPPAGEVPARAVAEVLP